LKAKRLKKIKKNIVNIIITITKKIKLLLGIWVSPVSFFIWLSCSFSIVCLGVVCLMKALVWVEELCVEKLLLLRFAFFTRCCPNFPYGREFLNLVDLNLLQLCC
jgi:hypothetical protein